MTLLPALIDITVLSQQNWQRISQNTCGRIRQGHLSRLIGSTQVMRFRFKKLYGKHETVCLHHRQLLKRFLFIYRLQSKRRIQRTAHPSPHNAVYKNLRWLCKSTNWFTRRKLSWAGRVGIWEKTCDVASGPTVMTIKRLMRRACSAAVMTTSSGLPAQFTSVCDRSRRI